MVIDRSIAPAGAFVAPPPAPQARAPRGSDGRSAERLHAHYVAERRLADRLRATRTTDERRRLCATMYDELFAVVPDHPRLTGKGSSTASRERTLEWDVAQLRPYLRRDSVFLEIGAGDCALASRVAREVNHVYAVDISRQASSQLPDNVTFVLTDGTSIDVPAGSVDVAFSDQLMEHLHPDDAAMQLANIHRALRPGGVYVCVTPNRLYGPSDISRYFDDIATGFHLREYSVRELLSIFREAGFERAHVYVGARGYFMRTPAWMVKALEATLEALPAVLRRRVAGNAILRALLGVRVAAIKGKE
jgi:SAM-dependent methyltransferase